MTTSHDTKRLVIDTWNQTAEEILLRFSGEPVRSLYVHVCLSKSCLGCENITGCFSIAATRKYHRSDPRRTEKSQRRSLLRKAPVVTTSVFPGEKYSENDSESLVFYHQIVLQTWDHQKSRHETLASGVLTQEIWHVIVKTLKWILRFARSQSMNINLREKMLLILRYRRFYENIHI